MPGGSCMGAGRDLDDKRLNVRARTERGRRLASVRAGTKLALLFRRSQQTAGSQRLPSLILSCYPRSIPTGRSLDALPSLPPVSGFLLQTSKVLAVHTFVTPLSACQSVRPAAF